MRSEIHYPAETNCIESSVFDATPLLGIFNISIPISSTHIMTVTDCLTCSMDI